jgi:putative hydrolase of the HAD superfamily
MADDWHVTRRAAHDRMTARPYDAVLCDIDGVVRHWPSGEGIERACGLPAGSIAAAHFSPSRLNLAITGKITDEQWRAAAAADLAAVYGSADRADEAVKAWSLLEPLNDPEVVSLLATAREVVTVALVSNATTRLEQDLARHGLSTLAHVVVGSARIGVAKPGPSFYILAAEQAGAGVDRCLFIDDTPANVAAARETGMTGGLYKTIGDLRVALAFAEGGSPRAAS